MQTIINFLKKLFGFGNKNSSDLITTDAAELPIYQQKPFMTSIERKFYVILNKLGPEYVIIPQINLATITKKISSSKYQNELFRNIDFAIFNNDCSKLLLLIEIDDATHQQKARQDRDLKVKKICNDINIQLMKFYSNYPNEEAYILKRIKGVLPSSSVNKEEITEILTF